MEILKRAVRYLIAIEAVKIKARQHNLTDEQKGQLREREATEKAAAESALLKLYAEVWLPRAEEGGLGIESVAVGGRPLQTTLNASKEAAIHERIMELLMVVLPRLFGKVTPTKIVELFALGADDPKKAGIGLKDVVEGFYAFLGFTRLTSSIVVRAAIVRGIQEGLFGYLAGDVPARGPDGVYQIKRERVRFEAVVPEDEVDLEAGFIIVSGSIPKPEAAPVPNQPVAVPPTPGASPVPPAAGLAPGGSVLPTAAPYPALDTLVEVSFIADRNQLFTAWNAAANLADLAGTIKVTLRAESEKGFDKGKLLNGVIEPLKEADLIE